MIYEPKRTALVVVPDELHIAINSRIDAAIAEVPDAAGERDNLYNTLLSFFDEYGYLPEFTLEKKEVAK